MIDDVHVGAGPAVSPALAPPPGNPRFALFDSLRGIAVLGVVTFHVASITGELNKHILGDVIGVLGNQALVIFFVVSGFLLYRPYVAAHAAGRARPRTSSYLRRRVLRIVPGFWAAMTLLAIYPGIHGVFSHDWWRYYLFLQVYSSHTTGGGIPPAWSLGVEVTFYAMLPLWAVVVRRLASALPSRSWLAPEALMATLFGLLGVSIQLAKARQAVSTVIDTTLLGECIWLALGMGLAIASVRFRDGVRVVAGHPGACWAGSLACLLGAAAVLRPRGINIGLSLSTIQSPLKTFAGIVLTGSVAVLLALPAVFGEFEGGWPRRVLAWRPLMLLGVVSYGVYLYHLTVAEWVSLPSDSPHFSSSGLGLIQHIPHLQTPIMLAITLVVTIALAAASYRFIELPFLRRKERARRP